MLTVASLLLTASYIFQASSGPADPTCFLMSKSSQMGFTSIEVVVRDFSEGVGLLAEGLSLANMLYPRVGGARDEAANTGTDFMRLSRGRGLAGGRT